MNSYRNREIDITKPVYVYRNLHRQCYSVKQLGKVVYHTDNITLSNCEFLVREKARLKVVETKQKNVHAFVKGYFSTDTSEGEMKISYNPYLYDSFVDENQKPIKTAAFCFLSTTGVKIKL